MSLRAAVFNFVPTFTETHGDISRSARAAREEAMDRLMAAAFTEIELGHISGEEPVPDEYIGVTLGAAMELSGILMMMTQDRINLMHHEAFAGVYDSVEDVVVDVLEEARNYLNPEFPTPPPASHTSTVEVDDPCGAPAAGN
jgi:hypothetical protein